MNEYYQKIIIYKVFTINKYIQILNLLIINILYNENFTFFSYFLQIPDQKYNKNMIKLIYCNFFYYILTN